MRVKWMCYHSGTFCVEVDKMGVVKLTVRLPVGTHRRLKRRVQKDHRSLNQAIVTAVEQWMAGKTKPLSEQERVRCVLRESGMLVELGGWVVDKYIKAAPDVTIEEIRALWKGQRPLSEDIIADRGER